MSKSNQFRFSYSWNDALKVLRATFNTNDSFPVLKDAWFGKKYSGLKKPEHPSNIYDNPLYIYRGKNKEYYIEIDYDSDNDFLIYVWDKIQPGTRVTFKPDGYWFTNKSVPYGEKHVRMPRTK